MAPVKCMLATNDFDCCQFKCCGSVVVEALFIVAPIVCRCFVFGPCFVMQYLVSLLFFESDILAEEKRAGCFSLIVFLLSCGYVRCCGLVCSV